MKNKIVLLVTAEQTATSFYNGYAAFLQHAGWEVTVIARSTGELERWGKRQGIDVRHVGFVRKPSPFGDVKALVRTVLLLRSLQPDVVVTATPKASLLGMVAARLTRVPVRIYQVWGLRLETETGLKRKLLAALETVTVKCATQCVANSHSLAQVMVDHGLARPGEVVVPGNGSSHGVDLEWFAPGHYELPPRTRDFLAIGTPEYLTVAFIGRLTRDKGTHTLIEAIQLAEADGTVVRALLVGRVEDPRVESQLQTISKSTVQVVAEVDDVRPYIANADVLCLPTLREGFPNVVLEAAAMGIPAIVSDATGAVDAVIPDETGWVFPVENAAMLAEKLQEAAASAELRSIYGANALWRARAEFEQFYVWELQKENIEAQLRESLGHERGAAGIL